MCRLLGYIGHKSICLAEVIKNPKNSLIAQSRAQHKGSQKLNADGFGLGWYNLPLGPEPATYRSTQPVWNDRNLHHFIEKTAAGLFIAHIRASTVGVVSEANCHPFTYGSYMMAHNGTIKNFHHLKRKLMSVLPDHLFLSIQGTTDSECLFYLILSFIEKDNIAMSEAVARAIAWIENEQKTLSEEHHSRINLVMSDGHQLVAARIATKNQSCHSLYLGRHPVSHGVVVSSEILGFARKNWQEIPNQSIVIINKNDDNWQIKSYQTS